MNKKLSINNQKIEKKYIKVKKQKKSNQINSCLKSDNKENSYSKVTENNSLENKKIDEFITETMHKYNKILNSKIKLQTKSKTKKGSLKKSSKKKSSKSMKLKIKKENKSDNTWIVYVIYKKIMLDISHMTKHNAECYGLIQHLNEKNIITQESIRRLKGGKNDPQSPPMKEWKAIFEKIEHDCSNFKEKKKVPKGVLSVHHNGKEVQYHFSNFSSTNSNKWPRVICLDRINFKK